MINSYRNSNIISPPITPSNANPLNNYLSVEGGVIGHGSPRHANKINENKLNHIENRICSLENDVTSLKVQMNKLTENIESLLETKNILNSNNMNFIMDECKKLVTVNLPSSKEQNYSNLYTNMNTHTNFHTIQNTHFRNPSVTDRNGSTCEVKHFFSDIEEERDFKSNASHLRSDKFRKNHLEESN
jgi:hypothetical protein